MCGIAGFTGSRNDNLLHQLSRDMAHRGPDGEGFFVNDHMSLLNRRLAIIDRAGGDQPIYNEDKSVVVVYNGEIYNYKELRSELEKSGHRFSTHSDTEVIVHGYEQWGDTCFDKLNGMFGIALYDLKNEKLLLVRDHFGIKPVYYADTAKGLIFASEIKPILYSGLVLKKPNDRIIYRYLAYRIHDDQRETFFDGIQRLLPGEMMEVGRQGIAIKSYTNLKQTLLNSKEKSELTPDDIESFQKLLITSVKMRLMSEVPVGTCLSGGLDSSMVVSVVNKLLQDKASEAASVGSSQNTFSAVFPGSTNDEERYIDALLTSLRSVSSHKVYPKPETFFTDLQDFVRTQEEPTISTGPYAQYKVMQEAHKYVTVLLDGQGADEMMAGYLPYYLVFWNELKKNGRYGELIGEVWGARDVFFKFVTAKFLSGIGWKKIISTSSLLRRSFSQKHHLEKFRVVDDDLKRRLVDDIFSHSLQSLLRYEDKNAMRFSIEGRVPFLDFNLLTFLFKLPTSAIIKHGFNKHILRKAAKDFLPALIRERRNKIGFTTPEHEWFMRMKNKIYSLFLSESFAKRPYFNQPEVLKAFQQFIEGKVDDTLVFWRLLNVELWLREFIDEKQEIIEVPVAKTEYSPNEGKKLEILVDGKEFSRYPVKTTLFQKGDNVTQKVIESIKPFFSKHKELPLKNKWFLVISEKVVAIAQGRSYFIWDIKPSIWAQFLSRFVKRTPFGIGLGSPWTMQLAIQEVGLWRILLASVASVITKPFGMAGVFYQIAGQAAASIDGPTEYSLYPSNVSAKLGPKDPQKVPAEIAASLRSAKIRPETFQGVVIIDANDIGRNILGNSTDLSDEQIAEIFRDNPMGQSNEQTPVVIVIEK